MSVDAGKNHLEVYGDSNWQDGWPETIVVFNTETRADEVYVRYRHHLYTENEKLKSQIDTLNLIIKKLDRELHPAG